MGRVLPEQRRQGIGGVIFERMLAHCRGRSLVALVATPLSGSLALFMRDVQ